MSLNNAHAADSSGVILFNGEWLIVYTSGVEFAVEQVSGGVAPAAFHGDYKGDVYLTSHRVILLVRDKRGALKSFSMPFVRLRGVELVQPIFGSNHLKGFVRADPDVRWAGWTGEARFKLWFPNGGCIEFGEALLNAVRLAGSRRFVPTLAGVTVFMFEGDASGAGAMPVPPAYDTVYAAPVLVPPPAYAPQNVGAYSFAQPAQATFQQAPPPGSVWMVSAPPPYPGAAPYVASSYAPVLPPGAAPPPYNPSAPPQATPPGFMYGPPQTNASAPVAAK
jgi:hypothetical protein